MTGTCPKDGAQLIEINRGGVLVDVCPECKGVWLDRGELEKIVALTRELEAEYAASAPPREQPRDQARREYDDRPEGRYDERGRERGGLGGLLDQARRALDDDRDDDRYDRRRDPRYTDPRYSRDSGEWDDDDRRKKKSGLGRLLKIFD